MHNVMDHTSVKKKIYIMDKKAANKMTVQVYILVWYYEPDNAHIERLKTLVPDQCKAVLIQYTVSSTHGTKTDLDEGILSVLAYSSFIPPS